MAPSVVPEVLEGWMRPFRCHFTAATWRHVLVLVCGGLLAPGRRTVAAALRVMGLAEAAGVDVYHRVLSQGTGARAPRRAGYCCCRSPPSFPTARWWSASATPSSGAGCPTDVASRWLTAASPPLPCSATSRRTWPWSPACASTSACATRPSPRAARGRGDDRRSGARGSQASRSSRTPCRRVRVEGWQGRRTRRLDIASGTALWYQPGIGPTSPRPRCSARPVLPRGAAGGPTRQRAWTGGRVRVLLPQAAADLQRRPRAGAP